jgi:hypothetical protein
LKRGPTLVPVTAIGRNGVSAAVFHRDPGDARGIVVKGVEAELVADEQTDKDAAGQADGEAENIDEGKSLFPDEVTKS